jgi:small multidrug resistance pump
MTLVIGGSLAFSVGGAFMKASHGFTRLVPSLIVAMSFLIGAGLLAKAVRTTDMSSTLVLSLGVEALITVAIGVLILGDRLSLAQGLGMLMVIGGVALVRAF